MKKTYYITTAIDYVNSLPHLGTAYEKVGADVIARWKRFEGYEVHFQMGNDEHSVNVKKEAIKQKLAPKQYCDQMREKFEAIWQDLEISYDDFIQTSELRHHKSVGQFFQSIYKNGDIEKKHYEGWYCESCEAFYTEKDLVDDHCPHHKTKPKWLKEDNYFFMLSRYQDKLLDLYKKHPEFIVPEIRRNEIVKLVEGGLQDISVSRSTFDWGIPLPIDEGHVIYVWFDALINYLTAIGYAQEEKNFKKWWPADLHVIGKDITRFHCVIWPAMLMSAGLDLPKQVFGHGFVYLKGEKMSKSLGNIVTPLDVIPKYGADPLRYFLLRESSFGSDGDFTWENFIRRYNSELANDIGNLLNRTLGMTQKYCESVIPKPKQNTEDSDKKLHDQLQSSIDKIKSSLDTTVKGDIDFHNALAALWALISATDKYIDTNAPWALAKKGETERLATVLYYSLDSLRLIAILLHAFLPKTSKNIFQQLGLSEKELLKQKFSDLKWNSLQSGIKTQSGGPLFPRIELEEKSKAPALKHCCAEARRGKELMDFKDFQKMELRVAVVLEAEKVEGTDKLLKIQVDLGDEKRQIVAGIAQHYAPEDLQGKRVVVVANLKPAKIRGVESNGMLLAASTEDTLAVISPEVDLPPGAVVR
jgi:methionyl-tRNA synthetase